MFKNVMLNSFITNLEVGTNLVTAGAFPPDQFLCDPAEPKFGFMTFAKRGREGRKKGRGREARTLHKSGADGTNSSD